jgi:hypothetical protein
MAVTGGIMGERVLLRVPSGDQQGDHPSLSLKWTDFCDISRFEPLTRH